ncbi:uncharacterized protein [Leptinotarsa decemlineata]|uniref:uncharacterized protein n=1 Tax=Leptinotarsa decemlineata TaxID=7539 RepID=UPI003D308427
MAPSECQTFVGNRISEIQKLTSIKMWRHVAGTDNPADLISRGKYASEIIHNSLWWNGPSWLSKDEGYWPKPLEYHSDNFFNITDLERKQEKTFAHSVTIESFIFQKFLSFTRLQRITAWCLRFISNVKNKEKVSGRLSVEELELATIQLIKIAQQADFSHEIAHLVKGKQLQKTSKILAMNPFIDEKHLLRVGGRIQNANVSPLQKHRYLLSPRHHLTPCSHQT